MAKTNFEEFLETQLTYPAVRAEFDSFSQQIQNVEVLLEYFDVRRAQLGLNKTQLATKMNLQPSNVRRLFSASSQNPSFATMIEMANALNLEFKLVPIATSEDARSHAGSTKNTLPQDA